MSWSPALRLRRYLRESLWVIPVVGGVLGILLGFLFADAGTLKDLSERWTYSSSTAESVLAAVVAASVGLIGFVVTGMLSVLIYPLVATKLAAQYTVEGGTVDVTGETGEY